MHLKKILLPAVFLLFLAMTGFDIGPYSAYEPVFMLRSEMEKSIRLEGPRAMEAPGKIYLRDHLIFINEKYRGIHVIDNSDPAEPENFAFIRIDGCIARSAGMKWNQIHTTKGAVTRFFHPDLGVHGASPYG